MRILIVIPQQDQASGNWVSAKRFQHGLTRLGHQVSIYGCTLHREHDLLQHLQQFEPDIALLLHAYRSGRPWLEANRQGNVPFLVMLTGTDVNHGLDDPGQREIITKVLTQARFVLLQNPIIAAELTARMPQLATRLKVISAGVNLGTEPFHLRHQPGVDKHACLFLCPAGLRPVKGLTELITIFDRVAAPETPLQLLYCGPVLDEPYARQLLTEVDRHPWAHYMGVISPEAMASTMRAADVVVNNSESEGLANSLLEAAALGVPILARDNSGNRAIVHHNVNGLLFNNSDECRQHIEALLNSEYRQQLSKPEDHDPAGEALELHKLCCEAQQTQEACIPPDRQPGST